MKPTQTLPENYRLSGKFDLTNNLRALILMNAVGLILLALAGGFFFQALMWLRGDLAWRSLQVEVSSLEGLLGATLLVILFYAAMIILHEAVHGVFFWRLTRDRPVFAFKWAYAYAAAPDWFLPRNQYLLVALAPFVVISLLGLVLFTFVPESWLLPVLLVATLNACGAVGDLYVAAWLLTRPASCLANDRGDAVALFIPVKS